MAQKRLTILTDTEDDKDIIGFLTANNISQDGRKLLNAGLAVHNAGMLELLLMLLNDDSQKGKSPIEVVRMAVDMASMMAGSSPAPVPKVEREAKPQPTTRKLPAMKFGNDN